MTEDREMIIEEKTGNLPVKEDGASENEIAKTTHIHEMYKDWFLDYASYVILERAVPHIKDGLKPVQRRILYSMKCMEDGRFNKVANIIGHAMQYHPHGDAAIGEAIILLGQKELLIDTQGNWGDFCTGDQAAAPRYIEARLSKFALEVVFNDKTTKWQLSYDGRKKEPVHLPVKFPLLLAQGVEGIAVGLSTKILPHNFNELINASIDILKGAGVDIHPDFPTGGMADFSNYNEGLKGGKVRIRTHIEILDKKTLVIREVPYGITTSSLIDSIIKANESNKIKIKRVIDNTAKDVEIVIELPPSVSPDITVDALYAFTLCEITISPNCCVIIDEKPCFISVNEILRISAQNTVALLKQEMEIKRGELYERLHLSSIEKIFIEKRIYRDIEKCETWEAILETIDNGLTPYKSLFVRDVTQEDIIHLTQIIIKRISRYDSVKADEQIANLKEEIDRVEYNLAHLTEYAISYFESLKKKYGKGRERRTEIRSFDIIKGAQVAMANQKLYVNRKEGFVGYGLKKDEFVCECSDLDDIILFFRDGTFMVSKVSEKAFVGKDILYVAVWKKNDTRMIYHMIYKDGASGTNYTKRFPVNAVTRDKVYSLTKDSEGTRVLYFSANPNSQSEVVTIYLNPTGSARKKVFDFDFATLAIKGRSSQGNIVTKHQVKRVVHKEIGGSTLGGVDIWYDDTIGRLNKEQRGKYLGSFEGENNILVIQKNGTYLLTSYELTNHYEQDNILIIKKFNPDDLFSVVHYDAEQDNIYVKRFKIETQTLSKPFPFINDSEGSRLILISVEESPIVEVDYLKGRQKQVFTEQINLAEFIDIKGWKARGKRLSNFKITGVRLMEKDKEEGIVEEQEDEGKPGGMHAGEEQPQSEYIRDEDAEGKNTGPGPGQTEGGDANNIRKNAEKGQTILGDPGRIEPRQEQMKEDQSNKGALKEKIKIEQLSLFEKNE